MRGFLLVAMSVIEVWLERLGYVGDRSTIDRSTNLGARPYAAEIADLLSESRGIGVANVYCVDDVPVVCFIDEQQFRDGQVTLRSVCRKIWNQGLATVLIVLGPSSLSAYSILRPEDPPEALSAVDVSETGRWSPHDIDTSSVQGRLPRWFEPERRVDRKLLKNLTDMVSLLEGEGLSRQDAEALMAQVIFVRYLEVRGIVGDNYRATHNVHPLPALIASQDGKKIDTLLRRLGKTFNGDFLNWRGDGPPAWSALGSQVFKLVERFLAGEELSSSQGNFWGYDFGIIPVELISGIYESFLAERKKKQGAYYTPRHLATLAVEQAFLGIEKPQKARVYDGACGSGILLTTAYQKMLAAAETSMGRRLRFPERVRLMESHIFGSDIDPTACWITAFSLCLCLLDRLTPSDVELLQKGGKHKLPVLLSARKGFKGNLHGGPEHGDFFSDKNVLANKGNWDVILSNPPWKEQTKSRAEFEVWIDNNLPEAHIPDRQIAAAYALRAALCTRSAGRITLILPLNLVIGTESLSFRQDLLALLRIERIINFADLRFLLFPNAHNACAMIVGQPRERRNGPIFDNDEKVEYWTPKTDTSLALGRIAISSEDRSWVSPHEIYEKRSCLIRRYWSSSRDLALIERLESMGTIAAVAADRGWIANKGFHATDNNNPNYDLRSPDWRWLGKLAFLPTASIPRDHPFIGADAQMPRVDERFKTVATPGGGSGGDVKGRLYRGPRVIWRNGLSPELKVRAAYTDRPFAFQHTACAIGGDESDQSIFQLLAAYLKSPLATYLLISNSYSLIADRNAASKDEILTLPFVLPSKHHDRKSADQVVEKIGRIFNELANAPEWQRHQLYEARQLALDTAVYDYFGLTEFERALVIDAANILAPSVQPRSYSTIRTSLRKPPDRAFLDRYREILRRALSQWSISRGGQGIISAGEILENDSSLFSVVRLSVFARRETPKKSGGSESLRGLLDELSNRANLPRGTALLIPDLIVADQDDIYLIKPMQHRFWLAKAALADADRIVLSIDSLSRIPISRESSR